MVGQISNNKILKNKIPNKDIQKKYIFSSHIWKCEVEIPKILKVKKIFDLSKSDSQST